MRIKETVVMPIEHAVDVTGMDIGQGEDSTPAVDITDDREQEKKCKSKRRRNSCRISRSI